MKVETKMLFTSPLRTLRTFRASRRRRSWRDAATAALRHQLWELHYWLPLPHRWTQKALWRPAAVAVLAFMTPSAFAYIEEPREPMCCVSTTQICRLCYPDTPVASGEFILPASEWLRLVALMLVVDKPGNKPGEKITCDDPDFQACYFQAQLAYEKCEQQVQEGYWSCVDQNTVDCQLEAEATCASQPPSGTCRGDVYDHCIRAHCGARPGSETPSCILAKERAVGECEFQYCDPDSLPE